MCDASTSYLIDFELYPGKEAYQSEDDNDEELEDEVADENG